MDEAIEKRLREVLAGRGDVLLAVLFGSFARGRERADSDVDIAVLTRGADLLALGAELARASGREVDVVSLDDPGVPLLEEIVRDGRVLHESSPGQAASWRSRALIDLETDRPWYRRMREGWLRHIAEHGLSHG